MDKKHNIKIETQKVLEHMLPVPDIFKVDEKFLYECNNIEYIDGFKKLRQIIIQIYKDMQKYPEENDIPIQWLMNLIYNFGKSGEIYNNELIINPAKYTEINNTKWVGYKGIKHTKFIINKLHDYGFVFSGLKGDVLDKKADKYVLSFPDDSNIIRALKGYIMAVPNEKLFSDKLIHLDYKLVVEPANLPNNQKFLDFASYFDGEERIFFEKFHHEVINIGYIYQDNYKYRMRYFKKAKDKNYTIECQSYDRKLFVGMKLKKMDTYSEYIASLPIHIKKMFMRYSCRHDCNFQGATPMNCRFRVIWHVDGVEYRKCSFEDVFVPPSYDINDIKYYIDLLLRDS